MKESSSASVLSDDPAINDLRYAHPFGRSTSDMALDEKKTSLPAFSQPCMRKFNHHKEKGDEQNAIFIEAKIAEMLKINPTG
jgi:hypothetical protein